jgi:hypothetical protein
MFYLESLGKILVYFLAIFILIDILVYAIAIWYFGRNFGIFLARCTMKNLATLTNNISTALVLSFMQQNCKCINP